jgi:hypothetical protein
MRGVLTWAKELVLFSRERGVEEERVSERMTGSNERSRKRFAPTSRNKKFETLHRRCQRKKEGFEVKKKLPAPASEGAASACLCIITIAEGAGNTQGVKSKARSFLDRFGTSGP